MNWYVSAFVEDYAFKKIGLFVSCSTELQMQFQKRGERNKVCKPIFCMY